MINDVFCWRTKKNMITPISVYTESMWWVPELKLTECRPFSIVIFGKKKVRKL